MPGLVSTVNAPRNEGPARGYAQNDNGQPKSPPKKAPNYRGFFCFTPKARNHLQQASMCACAPILPTVLCIQPHQNGRLALNAVARLSLFMTRLLFNLVDDRQFNSQRVITLTAPFSRFQYVLLKRDQKV
ncbi:hypothetical protein C4K13_5590 [Pseudomonas chlororaphis subsp. aureofaciens]|nr:hypothetical protein C4K13_5590 [Pseudomonas chlororaphis subsp. aureofaciens]AZE01306.1 hypothetical protein C4K12_5470 [Pseudomonas chlororaphis subsp. aureofaciens]